MGEGDEQLIEIVKQWIEIDEDLKGKQAEVRRLRTKRKELTAMLAKIMEEKNISGFNLNNDSRLVHKKQRVKGGITKKLLTDSLATLFTDEDEVKKILDFIMSQRTEKITSNIEKK